MKSLQATGPWCVWCMMMIAVCQPGCMEPMPVYAAYKPADVHDETPGDVPLLGLLPELYLVSPKKTTHDVGEHPPEVKAPSHVEPDAPAVLAESSGAPEQRDVNEPESEKLIGIININEATAAQLQLLPRVGEAMSERIVSYREKRTFARPSHLRRVKGIGKATYARFEMHLVVEGETTLRRRSFK